MRHSAFTLSEVLLAASILVVALCIILLEFITCAVMNQANRNTTRAATHIQYVLEDIMDTPFANVATNITAGNWDLNATRITDMGLTALNGEAIDTTFTSSGAGTLLDISVNAVWTDHRTRTRSLLIKTQLSQP